MIDTDALSGARDLARRERPLEGLRVLEFGSLIAGPFATRIMAEFGAEVIKVERPEVGDQLRVWRYVDPRTETSLWWALQSRNKKLVTLKLGHPDLSTPEKIALIEALAAAGLKRFEATSFVSPRAIPQLADAEDVLAGLPPADRVIYGGLIPNERGYERARRQPQRTRGGGNAATEDLVYMLTEMGIETGVALEPLMDAADLLERLVGHPLNTRIERSLLADSGLR